MEGRRLNGALSVRMILALLAVMLLPGTGLGADDRVQLVTGDWMPYSSSNPEEPGIAVEIVRAAFNAVNIETTLDFAPWLRCRMMVKEGMDVAAFPYVRTEARERFARFSVPVLTERTYLYYAKEYHEGFDFTGYEGLGKYRIGTLNGFAHQELFKTHNVPADVIRDTTTGLSLLLRNRLDFFPVNELVAKWELHRNFPGRADRFGRSATPLYELSLYLMVSPKNPRADHILDSFARGMTIIRGNGTVERIVRSYE